MAAPRQKVARRSITPAMIIPATEPSRRSAGRYTNINGAIKATEAYINAFQPVFHALALAIPAAVNDARQTGGVIWATTPK